MVVYCHVGTKHCCRRADHWQTAHKRGRLAWCRAWSPASGACPARGLHLHPFDSPPQNPRPAFAVRPLTIGSTGSLPDPPPWTETPTPGAWFGSSAPHPAVASPPAGAVRHCHKTLCAAPPARSQLAGAAPLRPAVPLLAQAGLGGPRQPGAPAGARAGVTRGRSQYNPEQGIPGCPRGGRHWSTPAWRRPGWTEACRTADRRRRARRRGPGRRGPGAGGRSRRRAGAARQGRGPGRLRAARRCMCWTSPGRRSRGSGRCCSGGAGGRALLSVALHGSLQ